MSGFGSIINGSNVYLTSLSASVVSASSHTGNGSGLTSITASYMSSFTLPIRTITSSTSIQTTDGVVLVGGSGNVTAFLPSASLCTGKTFYISNITTQTTNKVSSSYGGNLNGGTAAITLSSRASAGSGYGFVSDGTDWWYLTH